MVRQTLSMNKILENGEKISHDSPYPVYLQLREILKKAILENSEQYQSIPKEMELCQIYGLSRDSVRKAIAGLVEDGLLFRIKKKGTFIVQDHSVEPVVAPSPAGFSKIGVLWPYSEVWRECVSSIEAEIIKAGYRSRVTSYPWDNLSAEIDLLQEFRETCAGIIVYPNSDRSDRGYLSKLQADGFPIIMVDMYFPDSDISFVVSNNYSGTMEAVNYFITQGLKKIAFLDINRENSSNIERREGYIAALEQAGLSINELLMLSCNSRLTSHDCENIETLIVKQHPEAIFCAAHFLAYKCYRIAERNKISIPDQLAVTAFDRHESDRLLSPPLAAVVQQQAEIGQRAAKTLIGMIEGRINRPQKIFVPTEFKAGKSCLRS